MKEILQYMKLFQGGSTTLYLVPINYSISFLRALFQEQIMGLHK